MEVIKPSSLRRCGPVLPTDRQPHDDSYDMASSYATNRFPVPWLLTSPRLGYPALWVLAPRSRSHPSRAGWNQHEWGLIDISLSETVILAVCSHDLTASRCKRHAQSFRACDTNVALSRGYQRDVVVSAQRGSRELHPGRLVAFR